MSLLLDSVAVKIGPFHDLTESAVPSIFSARADSISDSMKNMIDNNPINIVT